MKTLQQDITSLTQELCAQTSDQENSLLNTKQAARLLFIARKFVLLQQVPDSNQWILPGCIIPEYSSYEAAAAKYTKQNLGIYIYQFDAPIRTDGIADMTMMVLMPALWKESMVFPKVSSRSYPDTTNTKKYMWFSINSLPKTLRQRSRDYIEMYQAGKYVDNPVEWW